MQQVYLKAKAVRLAIFDVDGVLTDGRLHYSDSGEETKVFDVRDGLGMNMLQASGVQLAIITSRTSRCVARRARDLGIEHLYQGVEDKVEAFTRARFRSRSRTGRLRLHGRRLGRSCRCSYAAGSRSRCPKRRPPCASACTTLRARAAAAARCAKPASSSCRRRVPSNPGLRRFSSEGPDMGDRYGSWFPLLLLAVLAAVTFWLDRIVQPAGGPRPDTASNEPDYIRRRPVGVRMDHRGRVKHTLRAQKMTHYPDERSHRARRAEIRDVRRRAARPSPSPRGTRACQAMATTCIFENDVRVVRAPYGKPHRARGRNELPARDSGRQHREDRQARDDPGRDRRRHRIWLRIEQ